MRILGFLTTFACVNAFNFGDLFGISLPPIPIPSGLLPTAFPTIPELPSGLTLPTGIPTAFPNLELPSIPALTSRLPIISVPPLPSFDIPQTELPSFAIPSEFSDLFRSIQPAINDVLKSLGVSPLPTLDRGAFASLRGAIPSFGDILKDGRDGLQEFIESYRGLQNRSLMIPSSESELRDMIRNKTTFNMDRLDSFVDSLGSKTGYDVAPSIRMIVGLALQNTSDVFTRATKEFELHASRLRDGVQQVLNFNRSRIELPVLPDLQNKSLSFIQFASNPYSAIAGGNRINSSVVSIMISDLLSGNETLVSGLTNAINFTIPGDFSGFVPAETACVYWNENLAAWTTDGCALSALAASIATCSCTHLTDFAVAAQTPVASAPVQSVGMVAASPAPSAMPPLPALQTTTPNIFMLPVGGTSLPSSNNAGGAIVGGVVGGIAGAVLVFGALGYAMYSAERRKRNRRLTVKAVQEKNPAVGV